MRNVAKSGTFEERSSVLRRESQCNSRAFLSKWRLKKASERSDDNINTMFLFVTVESRHKVINSSAGNQNGLLWEIIRYIEYTRKKRISMRKKFRYRFVMHTCLRLSSYMIISSQEVYFQ